MFEQDGSIVDPKTYDVVRDYFAESEYVGGFVGYTSRGVLMRDVQLYGELQGVPMDLWTVAVLVGGVN